MKDLTPFDFTPSYQPFDGEEVCFKLKPLDLQGMYEVQASMDDGVPGWGGIQSASKCIAGWSGPIGPFSRQEVNRIVRGEANFHWMVWLGHITGELYRRAILSEDDTKKS